MSKELVNALNSGDNIEAEKIFNGELATKVGDALELRRRDMAKTFVKSMENETD